MSVTSSLSLLLSSSERVLDWPGEKTEGQMATSRGQRRLAEAADGLGRGAASKEQGPVPKGKKKEVG